MWQDMLHTAVLEIMSYLPHYHLVSAGLVCRRWHSLSLDSLLWKAFLTRRFHLAPSISLRPGAESWRREFIRMTDEVPSVLTDLPDHPIQEARLAIHVTFAHSGDKFSVCYGSKGVGVWRAAHPCTRVSTIQTFDWESTSSKFNSSDSLLLITGISSDSEGVGSEMVAIYQAGGAVYPDHFSLIKMVKADCSFPYNGWVTDTAFLTTEAMDWDFRRVYLNTADPFDNEMNHDITLMYDVLHPDSQSMTFCSIRDGLPKMMFQLGTQELYKEDPLNLMGNHSWHLAPTRIAMLGNYQDLNRHTYSHNLDMFTPSDEKFPHMLIAGFCPSPDHEMCSVNVRPLTRNVELENNSPFLIAFESHEDLQIFPLNLTSMTAGPPLTGHKGLAHSNLDWTDSERLFPDVTSCYVGCGSEDGHGHLWDRYYGCHVSILSGTFKNAPEFPYLMCQPTVPHMLNLLGMQEEPPTVETEEQYNRPKLKDFLIDKSKATDEGNATAQDEVGENQDTESYVVEAEDEATDERNATAQDEGGENQDLESYVVEVEDEDEATVNNNLTPFEYEEDGDNQPVIGVALDPTREDVMVTIGKNGRIKVFRSKKWARDNKFGYKHAVRKNN